MKEPVECIYCFPVPATASVYHCEVVVNGKLIRARVMEREKAEFVTRERKLLGERTFLFNLPGVNWFRLELGNVQPQDRILVSLSYFQTIQRLQEECTLRIPFAPGIRYVPSPKAQFPPQLHSSRVRKSSVSPLKVANLGRLDDPPRYPADDPRGAPLFVQGEIQDSSGTVTDVETIQHPLGATGAGIYPTQLAEAQVGRVGCDWVVRWSRHFSTE
ncbi:MAG: hypothetical protein JNN07_27700 [Verrucomicrobiales bacterium]|nr:hypothetical protein [Verrucomicrobiales bacterium]